MVKSDNQDITAHVGDIDEERLLGRVQSRTVHFPGSE